VAGVRQRLSEWVCRRSFSPTEALLYESTVAPAVCAAGTPILDRGLAAAAPPCLYVGCGAGRITEHLRSTIGSAIGIDPSDAQVHRLHDRARHGLSGVQATADRLPFGDDSFGAVVASCSFKHWPDTIAALGECARVARPGGPVLIVELDAAADHNKLRAFARMTRFPPVIRDAYAGFLGRTVLPSSTTTAALSEAVALVPTLNAECIETTDALPFLVASLRAVAPQGARG